MSLYAVIDVETTGGSYQTSKLTEIAVYLFDGEKIIDEFSTLLNPEQPIPYMITRLTNITNEMVANAPKFCEVARKIVELTEGAIFVGHNAAFDYNFVRHEFKSLGYNYKRPTLCTVKMSRKVLPGHSSYSLGKLCGELNIGITNRHRAAGDAYATTLLLKLLLETDPEFIKNNTQEIPAIIKDVPEETGVYYLHDEEGKVIYIGKSNNMAERMMQHFRNQDTAKALEMKSRIASVSFEVTGSELLALLLESDEIKKHKPVFNRRQRRTVFSYSVYWYYNEKGYICFYASNRTTGHTPVTSFTSLKNAQNYLYRLTEKYQLCQKLCGLYETTSACFHYSIKQCNGACIDMEYPEVYNKRAAKALELSAFKDTDFFIIDQGRSDEENAVIRIAAGKYTGFGYIDKYMSDLEALNGCIKYYDDNRDTRLIIKNYINKHPKLKILKIKSQHSAFSLGKVDSLIR